MMHKSASYFHPRSVLCRQTLSMWAIKKKKKNLSKNLKNVKNWSKKIHGYNKNTWGKTSPHCARGLYVVFFWFVYLCSTLHFRKTVWVSQRAVIIKFWYFWMRLLPTSILLLNWNSGQVFCTVTGSSCLEMLRISLCIYVKPLSVLCISIRLHGLQNNVMCQYSLRSNVWGVSSCKTIDFVFCVCMTHMFMSRMKRSPEWIRKSL